MSVIFGGIDCGTSRTKVVFFNAVGECIFYKGSKNLDVFAKNGVHEQCPDTLISTVKALLTDAHAQLCISQ